jgi:hypothetical protein
MLAAASSNSREQGSILNKREYVLPMEISPQLSVYAYSC